MKSNALKADLVLDSLEADIIEKRFAPGERLPSMRKLTERFQVSISVIQNAMDQLEKKKLIDRRVGAGVFVHKKLKLNPADTRQVMICMEDEKHLSLPLNQKLQKLLMEEQATPISISGVSIFSNPSTMVINRINDMLESGYINSVIVSGNSYWRNPFLKNFPDVRAVFLEVLDYAGEMPERAVLFDLEAALYSLTSHMIKQGKKRIMLCTYQPSSESITPATLPLHPSTAIRMGYERALREFDLMGCHKVLTCMESEVDEELFNNIMKAPDAPDAIVCIMDFIAMKFINLAIRAGISVPEELAVSGLYDTPYAESGSLPITSAKFDLDNAAELTVQLALKDKVNQGVFFLKPELIVRESTVKK